MRYLNLFKFGLMLKENSNKNGSLYTTIEDKIPYYQSILDQSNKDRVKDGLNDINNDIKDTVGQDGYTFVDVMIIFYVKV